MCDTCMRHRSVHEKLPEIDGHRYQFKLDEEFLWLLASAIIPVFATALYQFDTSAFGDLGLWSTGLAIALIRALGGAMLAWWTKRSFTGRKRARR